MSISKKILTAALALIGSICIAIGLFFMPAISPSAAEVTVSGLDHFKVSNGVFQGLSEEGIKAVGNKKAKIDLTVLESQNVSSVASGGQDADNNASNTLFGSAAQYIEEVVLPAGTLTAVGECAFANLPALKTINLSEATKLQSIGAGAFRNCVELSSLGIASQSVTAVPANFARGCTALSSITLNDNIVEIGDGAFFGCRGLSAVTFPNSLKKIGNSAFYYCSKLTSVSIPQTVEDYTSGSDTLSGIGESAFSDCTSLVEATIPDTVKFTQLSKGVFQNCNKLAKLNATSDPASDFNLPANIAVINDRAFYGCIAISEVTIPQNVTNIGLEAFYGCQGINTINYNAKSATVQPNPFALPKEGYAASDITVNIGSDGAEVNQIPQGLFCKVGDDFTADGHRGVTAVNFVNVKLTGEGDDGWGINAFRNCTSLTSLTFDARCEIPLINKGAFDGCTSLYSIKGLDEIGLKNIGEEAFKDCSSLFSVTIDEGVTAIGTNAFVNCERLIEVIDLSISLTINKGDADNGQVARNALAVYTQKDTTNIDNSRADGFVFFSEGQQTYLLGYTGTATDITLPDKYESKVYEIYKKAFYCNTDITEVTIGNNSGILKIGDAAFAGCSALTKITFPSTLVEVGTNLMQDCVSLTDVTFNCERLSVIQAGMFRGCTKLGSITLPTRANTIGHEAFKGCEALTSVTFGKDRDGYYLEKIEGSAFSGCTNLVAIELPATVREVGQNAFENCGSLRFVYLSADRTETAGNPPATRDVIVTYGENVFEGCASDLILISASMAQYDKDVAKTNLSKYASKLTYIIELKLYYDNGAVDKDHTDFRLYGMQDGAGYVKNGLQWNKPSGKSMPQQEGYSISRWFGDADYKTAVDFDALTEMLNKKVEEVKLYARYVEKPTLIAKQGSSCPEYKEGMNFGINDILKNCFVLENNVTINDSNIGSLTGRFRYSVDSHTFVNGDRDTSWNWDPNPSTASGKVNQAGKYTLRIELEPNEYGVWSSPIELTFEIRPMEIDISDSILWRPDGGDLYPLIGDNEAKLYFYGDDVPYLEPKEGQQPSKTVDVINSYTIFSENEIHIYFDWRSSLSQYGEVVAESYQNNFGTEAGTYNAVVTLRPKNNYIFKYEVVPTPADLVKQGISLKKNNDGTMTVAKRWYIAISGSNHLMSADGVGMYAIPTDNGVAWNYLDAANVPLRPTLSTFKGEESSLISFTLTFNGEIVGKANRLLLGQPNERVFESYVNSSMPAGSYVLTFYIGSKSDGNNIVTGNPNGERFEFRVGEAVLTAAEIKDITDNKLVDINAPYESGRDYYFAPTASIDLLNKENPSRPQVRRVGIWENAAYDEYYTNFEISYSVKEGEKKNFINDPDPVTYYPVSAYPDNVTGAVPASIGSYTVFYKISAPNFSSVIKGRYELNITHILEKPVLSDIEFTGSSVIERVRMQLEDKLLDSYDIFTLHASDKTTPPQLLQFNKGNTDSYIGLGEHYVFILIKEEKSKYVVWDSSIAKDNFTSAIINGKQRNDFFVVKFEIVATQNREITSLSVNKWEFGEFTREDNAPNWVLQFNDDYSKYSFVLTSKNAAHEQKYYFYGDPARPLGVNELDFNKAPAGEYTLTATAPADIDNGVYGLTKTCDVRIDKATPRFTTVPFIDSWNYGNYKAENVVPAYALGGNGNEIISKIQVKYCTEAEYNKPNPALKDIGALLVDGQLPVGTYYLVYTLEEDENFSEWQYGVRFKVMRAENYWDVTPVIHDWVYGSYSAGTGAISYKPHFGTNVQLQYKNNTALSSWVNSIEALNGFDVIAGELAVGEYEFRAVVPVSANYNALVFQTTFNVTKASNSWKEVPGIKGWAEGNFSRSENSPYATAKFGNSEIKYTVTDENGKEYDINNLKALEIGTYKLTATIAGNDNYEELSSVVYFNVVEDSVGMTGLMIATIIFSVIALGLAAAGVTLLVLRSRKAEAEFRKAVKNELRRK